MEKSHQNDIFSRLFTSLYNNFEFEETLKLIKECSTNIKNDFFISEYADLFTLKCKDVMIENYLLLNSSIDTADLAKKFENDQNYIKNKVLMLINLNCPCSEISERDNVIYYKTNPNSTTNYV